MIIGKFVISERTTFLFLLAANIMFIVGGVGLLLYGIVRHASTSDAVMEAVDSLAYDGTMSIVTGIFEILLGCLGIAGAWFRKRILLMVYAGVLISMIVVSLIYVINTIVFTVQDNDEKNETIRNSVILNYGNNTNDATRKLTVEIDKYQNEHQCCGWSYNTETNIFLKTPWYTQMNLNSPNHTIRTLPDSCCRTIGRAECGTAQNLKEARSNRYIYAADCLEMANSNVSFGLWMSSVPTVLLMLLQMAAVTFTVLHLKQSGLQEGAAAAAPGIPPP